MQDSNSVETLRLIRLLEKGSRTLSGCASAQCNAGETAGHTDREEAGGAGREEKVLLSFHNGPGDSRYRSRSFVGGTEENGRRPPLTGQVREDRG